MTGPPFRVTGATLDVLEALLGPDAELYGLRIAQNTGLQTGSVYPILARLEGAGWVISDWETDTTTRGPRKRMYRLSPDGLSGARALLVERRGAIRQRTGIPARGFLPEPRPQWEGWA